MGDIADVSEVNAASIFEYEDEDSIYLQNVGDITHIRTVQQPKNRINIKINQSHIIFFTC
jgi:hypothetical protein